MDKLASLVKKKSYVSSYQSHNNSRPTVKFFIIFAKMYNITNDLADIRASYQNLHKVGARLHVTLFTGDNFISRVTKYI